MYQNGWVVESNLIPTEGKKIVFAEGMWGNILVA